MLWDHIELICRGYLRWDRFEHEKAAGDLSEGRKKLQDYLALRRDPNLQCFHAGVVASSGFLNQLRQKTRGFKILHPAQVVDLVANARRRGEEGKYDDAVARLYRALEMIGQLEFETVFQCPTGDAKPERLPESIREEYLRKHFDQEDQKMKLPLFAVFRALNETGNPRGLSFFQKEDIFKDLLSARNYSILAHGLTPISERTFGKMLHLICEAFPEIAEEVPFPRLIW